jgi:glycine hydroxymethyltransferase
VTQTAGTSIANALLPGALAGDPEIHALLEREIERQRTSLQLIASENFTSPAVLAASASVLTNKYSEGYPGRRYYGGNAVADQVEDLARARAMELFGAEHANVQPHAGANANLAAYLALVEPGDTILAMRLDQGGHLTHGSPVSITGKLYRFVAYGVTPAAPDGSGERIDMDMVRDLAVRERPRLIVAGATAYSRAIDPQPFRDIADEVGARFMFDAAHPAGLIAGKVHPNPVGIADVVTFTTHKTLRGPRGGAILCGADLAKSVDSAVFPGLQGGPLEHVIAAKAVAFGEALKPGFGDYASKVVRNAAALAQALTAQGFRLVAGGTIISCWSTYGPSRPISQARLPRRSWTARGSPAIATPSRTTRGLLSSRAGCASGRQPRRPPGSVSPRWPRSRPLSRERFAGGRTSASWPWCEAR